MHEKELCNVIYTVATVFHMNNFPCMNGSGTSMRSIGERPFQENKDDLMTYKFAEESFLTNNNGIKI